MPFYIHERMLGATSVVSGLSTCIPSAP